MNGVINISHERFYELKEDILIVVDMELTPSFTLRLIKDGGVLILGIFAYGLIGIYALLTGLAGIVQWKENGFQLQSFLFVVLSSGILGLLFIPNKDWMLVFLILSFVLLHVLAVAQGLQLNGQLTYIHHIVRFIFHCILVLLVYKFIK